jgi:glutamate racemase
MGSGVTCVDPSEVTSLEVKKILQAKNLLNTQNQHPKYEFLSATQRKKWLNLPT